MRLRAEATRRRHHRSPDPTGSSTPIADDIYALKKGHFTFDTETSGHNTGPIQLLGGTGDFVNLRGHGVDEGTADFDAGVGHATISGFVVDGSM